VRRNRRNRKVRYRAARFNNRKRAKGWLPPSLVSRIDNVLTWVSRLARACPISSIALELACFDTQALQNPEISGVEYQQGELMGYEVREYLLLKWGHCCAYCGKGNVPLQIEHIVPLSRGGSNRVSNLTLACEHCNLDKDKQTAEEYGFPAIQNQAQLPLRDAAAVNATRWALFERLQATGLPITCATGGRTKFNRVKQGYPKTHWLDAACIGETGAKVEVNLDVIPLLIQATGRQARQMCRMNKYGFPRTSAKQARYHHGFQTGDMVRAVMPSQVTTKAQGRLVGRVAARATGSFRVGAVEGVKARYCRIIQRADGYDYQKGAKAHSSSV
jgi:5-methylcytosine-specific restriction endonuclease McrA